MFAHFHPLTKAWFTAHVGTPTDIQHRAWPAIAAGEHVLAVAPTGSGKTLTAFLSALDSLATGKWPVGQTSVVYVTPLKALGNDVRRNLAAPLAGLRRAFEAAGQVFPSVRVAIRTGDTPADERRHMARRPPEILLTTPESLNLLVSSRSGRAMLGAVRLVILDEIHAVAGTKRGAFLLLAVERLALLAGEFQRVALSATVAPLPVVAAMVGGLRPQGDGAVPRPVTVIEGRDVKACDIRVRHVSWPLADDPQASRLAVLAADIRRRILANRTTLIFVNSRRLCEKLARFINDDPDGTGETLAHAHHGSLSRELRAAVEARLKAGELRAVVATQSLELGIDIGDVTEVLLVECPPTVSAALQRLGRSGHAVGEVSRAVFFPTSERDLLEAAVMAKAAAERNIEALSPVEAPLDVLAQTLVAMAGVEAWDVDALFAAVRRAWPYRELSRRAFDLTLAMLTGRYAATRIRELSPLLAVDGLTGQVTARPGALLRLYASGGVIADRGYYALRRQDTGTRIGELDEVFVWEARLGQIFAFGAQNWRIERITDADVFASPAPEGMVPAPFWIGDGHSRDRHFSRLVAAFLEEADVRLEEAAFRRELVRDYFLEEPAAEALLAFLRRQKEATGAALPHARHLLVEVTATGPGGAPGSQIILHAPLGLAVTAPLSLVLEAAGGPLGSGVPVFAGNDCVALTLPGPVDPEALLERVTARDIPDLLRQRLEGSGAFGAAFREAAGRALLLPREGFGKRTPLWINRLRARKLLAAVAAFGDFPMVLEAWRTCLDDVFDVAGLVAFWSDVHSRAIAVTVVHTRVQSPFAADLRWRHINEYMYLSDAGTAAGPTGARPDLVAEVARSAARPCVPASVARDFEGKRQRLAPGYAPATPAEVLELLKERVVLPEAEWTALLAAVERDHGVRPAAVAAALAPKLARLEASAAGPILVVALERAGRVARALYGEAARIRPGHPGTHAPRLPRLAPDEVAAERQALLVEWFSFYGPLSLVDMANRLGLAVEALAAAAEVLESAGKWLSGPLVSSRAESLWCDAASFEMLLRLARAARRPHLPPAPAERLPYFLAVWQGLVTPADDAHGLAERLERLACLPLPAGLWERDVLPARCRGGYDPAWLDGALSETGLAWFGSGRQRVLFARPEDLDLVGFAPPDGAAGLFPDPRARYDFSALLEVTGQAPADLTRTLWQAVWKGQAACDAVAVLRRGVATDFTPEPAYYATARQGHRRLRPTRADRFAAALPTAGSWYRPRVPPLPADALAREELALDRARLLLERYGVVCRDVLSREAAALGWAGVFRALRRLELAGEVVAGEFFAGLSGPQFALPRAVRLLAGGLTGREPWWCAALDPAWGPGVAVGPVGLRRVAGTQAAFCGPVPVLVSEAGGSRLTIVPGVDAAELPAALAPLRHVLGRKVGPERRLCVVTINGIPAGASPYLPALGQSFEVVRERRGVTLYPARNKA